MENSTPKKLNKKVAEDLLVACTYRWLKTDSSDFHGILIYNKKFDISVFRKKSEDIATPKLVQVVQVDNPNLESDEHDFHYCHYKDQNFDEKLSPVEINEEF